MRIKKFFQQQTKWQWFALSALTIQTISSIVLCVYVILTKMLPLKFLVPVILGLILFIVIAFFLMYYKQNRHTSKKMRYFRRGLGTFISVLMIAICIYGSFVLHKALSTLNNLTSHNIVETNVGVYVLKEDKAEKLKDAANYTFGINKAYEYDDAKDAVEAIEEELDKRIKTKEYKTVTDMIDALKSGEIQSLILSETYEDILQDIEGYEDFSSTTKIIYEFKKTEKKEETRTTKDFTKDPFVVYVSGSDTYNRTLVQSRSDVNILAFVNPTTRQVLLLNTPRDTYVDLSVSKGNKDKLTHCGNFGIQCSMDTLANFYSMDPIDRYGQINFTGFMTLIDAMGGIDVYSDATFTSDDDFHYVKGMNHLNGDEALSFVRDRHNLADGDSARGRHQMAMIAATVEKITGSTTLLTNYSKILDSLEGMIATSFTADEISSLVNMQLSKGGSWEFKTYTIEGHGKKLHTYSIPNSNQYVLLPYTDSVEHAKSLIKKIMSGKTLTDSDIPFESNKKYVDYVSTVKDAPTTQAEDDEPMAPDTPSSEPTEPSKPKNPDTDTKPTGNTGNGNTTSNGNTSGNGSTSGSDNTSGGDNPSDGGGASSGGSTSGGGSASSGDTPSSGGTTSGNDNPSGSSGSGGDNSPSN